MIAFLLQYDISIHYFYLSVGEFMKNFIKKICLLVLLAGYMIFLLIHSKLSKEYAALGLNTWFTNIIPALLPFMILSGILIRLNLAPMFAKPFGILLRPVFKLNDYCIYVLIIGFFCGFPMGAKSCMDLYRGDRLTKEETEYLLAFTNNIGPSYFTGYVLNEIYQPKNLLFSCFLMFGVPFLYGLCLRHTLYRTKISASPRQTPPQKRTFYTFFDAIDESITGALTQITILGGYMIFFNLFVVILFLAFRTKPIYFLLHSLVEISGGFMMFAHASLPYKTKLLFVHAALSFNGLCCLFQTLHLLKGTDISGQKYMLHKAILCSITTLLLILLP